MTDNNEDFDIKKYAEDIKTIKSMLQQVDEKPFIDNWAFFSWGILCIIGSIIHWIGWKIFSLNQGTILYDIWLPIIIIGGIFESIAWVRRFAKESIPLFNKQSQKLFISMILMTVIIAYMTYAIVKLNGYIYLPSLIILYIAMGMIFYANVSYFHLQFTALAFSIAAVIIHYVPLALGYKFIIATLILGIGFIVSGFANMYADRLQNDR